MTRPEPSWWARLAAGRELDAAAEACHLERLARQSAQAELEVARRELAMARAELHQRNRMLDALCLVSETDARGDIVEVNDRFCEVSKFHRDELIGRPYASHRHPAMSRELDREMALTLARGQAFRGTLKNRAKDGSSYWVQAAILPVAGEDGRPRRFLGVHVDISPVERGRRAAVALANGLLAALEVTHARADLSLDGTVLRANAAFCMAMGCALDEIVGRHHRGLLDPADAGRPDERELWADLRAGRARQGLYRHRGQHGREVWLLATYVPLPAEGGEVDKVMLLAIDVTEARAQAAEAERQLASLVQEMRSAADPAAGEIAATARNLSQVTVEQAWSVVEASMSIERLGESIASSGERAREAAGEVVAQGREADEGGVALTLTLQVAKQVTRTAATVDELAQRARRLAASVSDEAARDDGRSPGLAAVADEARQLAERSQDAARAIGDLAVAGSDAAARAGRLIHDVLPALRRAGEQVHRLAASAQEQGEAAARIGETLSRVRHAALGTADICDALATGAQALDDRVAALREALSAPVDTAPADHPATRPAELRDDHPPPRRVRPALPRAGPATPQPPPAGHADPTPPH